MNISTIFNNTFKSINDVSASAATRFVSSLTFGQAMAAFYAEETLADLGQAPVLTDEQALFMRQLEARQEQAITNCGVCLSLYTQLKGDNAEPVLEQAYGLFLQGGSKSTDTPTDAGLDPDLVNEARKLNARRDAKRGEFVAGLSIDAKLFPRIIQVAKCHLEAGKGKAFDLPDSAESRARQAGLTKIYNAVRKVAAQEAARAIGNGTLAMRQEANNNALLLQAIYRKVGEQLEKAAAEVEGEFGVVGAQAARDAAMQRLAAWGKPSA